MPEYQFVRVIFVFVFFFSFLFLHIYVVTGICVLFIWLHASCGLQIRCCECKWACEYRLGIKRMLYGFLRIIFSCLSSLSTSSYIHTQFNTTHFKFLQWRRSHALTLLMAWRKQRNERRKRQVTIDVMPIRTSNASKITGHFHWKRHCSFSFYPIVSSQNESTWASCVIYPFFPLSCEISGQETF